MADLVTMGPKCKYCGRYTQIISFQPKLMRPLPMKVCDKCDRYSELCAADERQTPTES